MAIPGASEPAALRSDDLAARVRAALTRPEAYPDRPSSVEVRETHISCVFLAGDRAYKLKKPLTLDFLDYGTPSRRRRMCEAEIRLNRRLSDDVYLGVRGIVLDSGDGGALTGPDDPRAVDYVVEMRRYDERDTLAAALRGHRLRPGDLGRVAARIAAFHATAAPASGAGSAAVLGVMSENVDELLRLLPDRRTAGRVRAVERFLQAFVITHRAELDDRAARGRVRDGHGDLRAAHVLLEDAVQIVDCVEFDPRLRRLDVADDLAFLVADLATRGAWRHAQTLVDGYRAAGGDPGGDDLIAFYAVHRALVRAKVARLRAGQLPAGSAPRRERQRRARTLLAGAERLAWRARGPVVLVVCGVPGSGKTWLARELHRRSALAHISSDVTRKRLAGVGPAQPAPAGSYTEAVSRRTYAALGEQARAALAGSDGAIVDATFRHRTDRTAFAVALGPAPVAFIECRAPHGVLLERARRRGRSPEQPSDAGPRIVAGEAGRFDPLDEIPAAAHLILRTDRPLQDVTGELEARLDRRLRARTARPSGS